MIDFSRCQLHRFARLMSTLSGNNDPTEYFDLGRMIEFAWQEYSDNQLTRINEQGKDLIDADGLTYESKCITFRNKGQNAARGVIVANGYGTPSLDRFTPADYYLFTDYRKKKIAWVSSDQLYRIKVVGTTITASADPHPDQFLNLPVVTPLQRNFFEDKHTFTMRYISEM